MNIESLIIKRLQESGRVHLPGWGSFYLEKQVAKWDAITSTAFPSGKYISFRASISSSENTLVGTVMRELGSTMEVAEHWIHRKVFAWQQVLDEGGVLMLPGIGSFPAPNVFKPDGQSLDAQSFGLTPVMVHAINEPSALQTKVVASLKMATEQRATGLRTWQRASAAAAVALLFGLGLFQSPWSTEMAGWFTSPAQVEVEDGLTDEVEAVEELTTEEIAPVNVVETPAPPRVEMGTVEKGLASGYSIVVGSFKMPENAENLAQSLASDGMDVHIISGSLVKVGVGHYSTRAEAKQALQGIKASVNSHAWIYGH